MEIEVCYVVVPLISLLLIIAEKIEVCRAS